MSNNPRTPATQVKQPPILGSIVCTPPAAVVGQSVCIEVRGPDGKPYDNAEAVPISINGVPGSRQWVVWKTPGTQSVRVLAQRRGAPVEKLVATVEVAPAAEGPSPPFLRVQWDPAHPTRATFSVYRLQPRERSSKLAAAAGAAHVTVSPIAVRKAKAAAPVATAQNVARVTHAASVRAAKTIAVGGPAVATYTWQLAGSASIASARSTITHDFGPQLDPDRAYGVFDVSVTIEDPGSGPITIRRTVSVANAYNLMKRRGVLQPGLTAGDESVRFDKGQWKASFTVRNPEPFALTLTSRRIDLIYDTARATKPAPAGRTGATPAVAAVHSAQVAAQVSPNAALAALATDDRVRGAAEAVHEVLPAKSTKQIDLVLPHGRLAKDVIAIVVHYSGSAPNHPAVRVTAAFDIPQHVAAHAVLSPAVSAAIGKLAQAGLVTNPKSVKKSEITRLVANRAVAPGAVAALTQPPAHELPHVMDAHGVPPPAGVGDECDPWNLPDVVPDGMFCMPTAETRHVMMPARFMNANKGDIILSPGDGSLIGETLAAVSPPQPYSHSGMMTRNRDEITHSTASLERMTDSDYAGSGGFRPDILKFLWPGAITQTVQHAVDGEKFVDPENGKPYQIGGFGSMQSSLDLGGNGSPTAWAMVVKPDPELETPEVRAKLHAIAEFHAAQQGKSHYRFFCYTNPAIGLTDVAPDSAKWAAGTFPSVCSSLIWRSIRNSGEPIEGALEPADMTGGAQIATDTPDGLYVYQADERLAAGEVLYDQIAHLATMAAGQFWAAITDIKDNLGNQVLNAFASDWCDDDATDSDKWKQTTDANAVSPQNLMFYDSPLYGYSEPVIYRDQRMEEVTVYKWKLVKQTGTVTGHVRHAGKAVAGADVQITAAMHTHTDANGQFTIDNVPVGDVIVEAQKEIDNLLMSAAPHVQVTANHTTDITIDLAAPSHVFRRIVIDGSLGVTDYEFAAAAYPHNYSEFNGLADLDPGTATHVTKTFDCVCDDDTLGRLFLTFDLQPDDSVIVKTTLRCYDSDKADTDDYDEAQLDPFTIGPGGHSHWTIYVDGENYAEAYFHVENTLNPS